MIKVNECEFHIVPIHDNSDEFFAAAKKGVRFIAHAVQGEMNDADFDNAVDLTQAAYKKVTSEKTKSKFKKFKNKIKKAFESNRDLKENKDSEENEDYDGAEEAQMQMVKYDPWGIAGHEQIDLEDLRDLHVFVTQQGFTIKYEQIKTHDEFTDDLQKRLYKLDPSSFEPPVLRDHIKFVTTSPQSFQAGDLPMDYVSDPISIGVIQFTNGHMYDVSYVNRVVEYGEDELKVASSWYKWGKDFDIDDEMYDEWMINLPEIPSVELL